MRIPIQLIEQVQSVLSANLLHKSLRKKVITGVTHVHFGHCYGATEALYHLWGKKNGFVPYRVEWKDHQYGKISHWYLSNGDIILDVTEHQFDYGIPHEEGKRAAFLTTKPSNRAKEIIRRLKVKL